MADAFTPMAQESDNATTSTVAAPSGLEPFFSGPSPTLWIGVLAAIAIFVILIAAIIRVRVTEPAKRKARQSIVFEPAGADADIVFEDEQEAALAREAALQEQQSETVFIEDDHPEPEQDNDDVEEASFEAHNDDDNADRAIFEEDAAQEVIEEDPVAEPTVEKKKRGPFAGLFSKRDAQAADAETADTETNDAPRDDDDADLGDLDQVDEAVDAVGEDQPEIYREETSEAPQEDVFQSTPVLAAVPESPDRERILFEAEERDRVIRAAREEAAREAAFERRKMEASFEERLTSLAAVERSFADRADAMSVETNATRDHLNQTIDERFAALSEALKEQLDSGVAAAAAKSSLDDDAMVRLGDDIRDLREATQAAISGLGERIDAIDKEPQVISDLTQQLKSLEEKASVAPVSALARVQLKTLISDALPRERYDFARTLSSGRTPDCCVTVRAGGPPLAIDAQFPIAAYERRRTEADNAKSDYRRAVLQHIVDVAEKCIIAGETEQSALLYAPAETIFNDLHANFPDLIEDALRARVWIVSPTSLMAILHAMSFGAQLPKDAPVSTDKPVATTPKASPPSEEKTPDAGEDKPAPPAAAKPRVSTPAQRPEATAMVAPPSIPKATPAPSEAPKPGPAPREAESTVKAAAPEPAPSPSAAPDDVKTSSEKPPAAQQVGVPAKARFIRQVHTKATPTFNLGVDKPPQ